MSCEDEDDDSNNDPVYCTVSFNSNDADSGKMSNLKVEKGKTVVVPRNSFVKSGYNFLYWVDSNNYKKSNIYYVGDIIKVTKDMVLYAYWKKSNTQDSDNNTYTITFDANGGTGKMDSIKVSIGIDARLPKCTFERDGYIFTGWSKTKDNAYAYYYDCDDVHISYDITLYAIWESAITVTFNANGGTGEMDSIKVKNGGNFTLPNCTFKRDGYSFVGWIDKSDELSYKRNAGSKVYDLKSDITYYVQWAQGVTITFDANGGDGVMEAVIAKEGDSVKLPKCTFTKERCVFNRWEEVDGYGQYSDESTVYYITKNITLRSIWTYTSCIIHFDANGGGSAISDVEVTAGEVYTIPLDKFTREHYTSFGKGGTWS